MSPISIGDSPASSVHLNAKRFGADSKPEDWLQALREVEHFSDSASMWSDRSEDSRLGPPPAPNNPPRSRTARSKRTRRKKKADVRRSNNTACATAPPQMNITNCSTVNVYYGFVPPSPVYDPSGTWVHVPDPSGPSAFQPAGPPNGPQQPPSNYPTQLRQTAPVCSDGRLPQQSPYLSSQGPIPPGMPYGMPPQYQWAQAPQPPPQFFGPLPGMAQPSR